MLRKKNNTDDLTEQQYQDNYWRENKYYKEDGSTVMMETRRSKCAEADNGKEFGECSKEVKTRMVKAGSENTMKETLDIEEEKEEETTDDNTTVCKKKLDFLEKFYEDNKEKVKIIPEIEKKLDMMTTDYTRWKKAEDEKISKKVDKRIKKLSEDFLISEEKIRAKIGENTGKEAIRIINDFRELIEEAGVKVQGKEEEEVVEYNTEDLMSDFEKQREEILAGMRHK